MKKIIYLLGFLLLISCEENPYSSTGEIVNLTISHKETQPCARGGCEIPYMWFQAPTETFQLRVSDETYNSYAVGSSFTGLIITKTIQCPEK